MISLNWKELMMQKKLRIRQKKKGGCWGSSDKKEETPAPKETKAEDSLPPLEEVKPKEAESKPAEAPVEKEAPAEKKAEKKKGKKGGKKKKVVKKKAPAKKKGKKVKKKAT